MSEGVKANLGACSWLDRDGEGAIRGDVAEGHAGGVEGEAGVAVAVEKDEAAGGVGTPSEQVDGFASSEHGVKALTARLGGCCSPRHCS